jgi:hypothetical protein
MNRMLKAGIAFAAALALTAVMASVASAQFTSTKEHTILSGSQKVNTNDVFSAGEGFGGITCQEATFSGTSTGELNEKTKTYETATQVITPTYKNCKDSFGRTVDIDNGEAEDKNTLTYTFTSGLGKGTVHVSGSMTLTVTSGGSVICTVKIKSPQTNNGISYTNIVGHNVVKNEKEEVIETREDDVETTTHATNVISTTEGGFFNCGISNGEHTKGTYDGTSVISGVGTDGAAAKITVD